MHEKEYYLPENHEYVTHHTYTGVGCAICGKEETGHKAPTQKTRPVRSKGEVVNDWFSKGDDFNTAYEPKGQ